MLTPAIPDGICSDPHLAAARLEFDRLGDDPTRAAAAIEHLRLIHPLYRVSSAALQRAELLPEVYSAALTDPLPATLMLRIATVLAMPDFPALCRTVGGMDCPLVPLADRHFCVLVAVAGTMTGRQRIALIVVARPFGPQLASWALPHFYPGEYGSAGSAGEAASAAACAPSPAPDDGADDPHQPRGELSASVQMPAMAIAEAIADDDPSP